MESNTHLCISTDSTLSDLLSLADDNNNVEKFLASACKISIMSDKLINHHKHKHVIKNNSQSPKLEYD